MPIVFILTGLYLIFIFFNFDNKNFKLNKISLISFLIFIEVGYFVGDFVIVNLSINIFHLISLFLFFYLYSLKFNLSILLISIIVSLIYYLLIDRVLNIDFIFILFSILPVFIFDETVNRFAVLVSNSIFMLLVKVYFEIDFYTMSSIDFDLFFQSVIVFVLLNIVHFYKRILFLGECDVKKGFTNYNFHSNVFNIS